MRKLFTPEQDREVADMYLSGTSTNRIAKHFSLKDKQPVLNSLHRTNTPTRKYTKRIPKENKRRMIKGYVHLYKPNHPNARSDGYIPEHRHIVSERLGRPLTADEVVNHIDTNRLNNDPDNLELFATNGAHIAMHNKTTFQRAKDGKFTASDR